MKAALLALAAIACAETHRVVGESYYHTFSSSHPVLMRVKPRDRIVTKTVDSAGFDFSGTRRTKTHGNPLTGAFYVEGAEPGDALVVKIESLRLNRDTGYTGYQAGAKDLAPGLEAPKPAPNAVIPGYDYLVPWVLDRTAGFVWPKASPAMRIAARPMLGCIGVAPEGDYSPRSGPAGYWGGNMDYPMVREGTTVYLPVYHPGALLFFGDGHAVQGDGEAIGSGVETSLDVEITVDLRKKWKLTGPRLEIADRIISVGSKPEATLNDAAGIAVADMLRWLTGDYGMTPAQAHLLIGTAAHYDVASMAGVLGLGIPKRYLPARQ